MSISIFKSKTLITYYLFRADGGLAPTEGGDDGIVGGPRTPQQIAAQKRLQQTQAQVDEVILNVLLLQCKSILNNLWLRHN